MPEQDEQRCGLHRRTEDFNDKVLLPSVARKTLAKFWVQREPLDVRVPLVARAPMDDTVCVRNTGDVRRLQTTRLDDCHGPFIACLEACHMCQMK